MRVFLVSTALLALAWVIHLVIWRVRLPRRHIATLLVVFAAVFAGWLVAGLSTAISCVEHFQIAMLYGSAALSYVITYSAIEGDSPTLSLMQALAKMGDEGLSDSSLDAFVAQRPFVKARIAALIQSGLVREENGSYVLDGKPSLFFRLILGFRKLYGPIAKGG